MRDEFLRLQADAGKAGNCALKPAAMPALRLLPPAIALPVLLAGCAAPTGEFPSLAIRDAERVSGTMEPPAPPPAPPPPVLADAGGVDALLAAARAAHADFTAALPAARTRVSAGAGAAPGSDNWAAAQIALAELQSGRSRVSVPMADLDRMYVAALSEGLVPGAIGTAREEVDALLAAEDAAISALSAQLRQ